ncbi:MAG: flagellar biosynthetic protein FliR [Syntrophaceticus sp.]|jgi:flagellar biosynthetic protein FliR
MEFLFFDRLNQILLIWGRIAGFFITAVPFSMRNIPLRFKVGMAAVFAYLVFMTYLNEPPLAVGNMASYVFLFIGELLIGCILGFITQIVFSIFRVAGHYLDVQMGLGVAQVIDPEYGTQVPLLGNLQYMLALLTFLAINGHHVLIAGLFQSYRLIPIAEFHYTGELSLFFCRLVGEMFLLAFQIALPVVGALLITDLVLGVIARTVPQMNVFFVALPLKIALGFGLILIMVPLFIWAFEVEFERMFEQFNKLLMIMRR